MILTDVMDQLGAALDTIPDLRVSAYPADTVSPPAALVGYPETVTFDVTMGRGVDRYVVPVFVLLGRVSDRGSRAALGPYLDGGGAKSVKKALTDATYAGAATVRVTDASVEVVTVNAVDYLTIIFSVDITGPGG